MGCFPSSMQTSEQNDIDLNVCTAVSKEPNICSLCSEPIVGETWFSPDKKKFHQICLEIRLSHDPRCGVDLENFVSLLKKSDVQTLKSLKISYDRKHFDFAVQRDLIDVVDFLLQTAYLTKADLDSALFFASSHKHLEMVKILVIGGADVMKVMEEADERGTPEQVEFLRQFGNDYHTLKCFDQAKREGLTDVIDFLIGQLEHTYRSGEGAINPKKGYELAKVEFPSEKDPLDPAEQTEERKELHVLEANARIIEKLGKEGFLENTEVPYEKSAAVLIAACENGHADEVEKLLKTDINIHAKGDLAIYTAAAVQGGHIQIVELLIDQGVNLKTCGGDLLSIAAELGNIEIVRLLLDRGADIHQHDEKPLEIAVACGNIEMVSFLLERGADLHANIDGAFRIAVESNYLEIAQFLLQNGADVHVDDELPLRRAVYNDYTEMTKLILENGADLHVTDNTPLRLAAGAGHYEIVELLLTLGADVHANDDECLKEASRNGHLNVVQLLLNYDANLHAENDFAARTAAENNHQEILHLLLELGADLNTEEQEFPK